MSLHKKLYLILGYVAFALGFIGIFLPIMPTTPFMIVAAYFFSKSSARMHQWLLARPHIGPAIYAWEAHRVIRTEAKAMATGLLAISIGTTLYFIPLARWVQATILLVNLGILAYIWTRRSRPSNHQPGSHRRDLRG